MKRQLIAVAIAASVGLSALSAGNAWAEEAMKVNRYTVAVPEKFYVNYQGSSKQEFPKGFRTGFGSGIAVKSVNKDGSIEFYMITDRGPNGDGPEYQAGNKVTTSKFFPSPSFQPQIALARLKAGKVEIIKTIGLKDETGKPITGLPIKPGSIGSTNEIALDEKLTNLGYDSNGLDTEGIAVDAKGNFWVCDEYGPFIAQFNREGKLLRKYAPGAGLPEVLKYRIPNRGFEGIAIAPNGHVFAAVQSTLDIDGKTAKKAQFTRLVELDPVSGKTRMYAYPIDVGSYKSPKDAKIGDIFAVSNNKLLLIEQAMGKDKKMRNLVYLVDTQAATDLSGVTVNGVEPEFISDQAGLAGITFATKRLLVDLRALGWETEKAEGITLLPDRKTIVVTNDNDFGMAIEVDDSANPEAGIGDYTLNADKTFTHKGVPAAPKVTIVSNSQVERYQYLWTIELPEPLQ
ncbi:esterase-like activity of phytase family protein [Sporomusa sp. KB1]|jgi:hypothetical protein|uniref:esterase-like activity of phytase family protein n=1 Tax=Sporomusa sp. KB1 TaxID=943346 RepID=UPI0011AC1719|nr:esterase-like activity of phytase family protein [Sporomusa sp. KB1]TWH45557.1 hypothetical protein Salpa_1474 [Sporomusa sp. KB1]